MNLNVDSISDALTAQVGGIGAAPGPNQSDSVACFEATYGTVPKCTDKDNTNAGSETLSAELRPRHRAWKEAADLILRPLETAMLSKNVTCWRPELTGAVHWSIGSLGENVTEAFKNVTKKVTISICCSCILCLRAVLPLCE